MALKTISGSSIVLQVHLTSSSSSPTDVAASTSGVLTINSETIDITNKNSSGSKDYMHGVTNWSVDCDAFVLSDSTGNRSEGFATACNSGTKINVKFYDTSGQTNSTSYEGNGFVTSWTETGSVGEFATYSATIQGTGALTIS
jgi:predicted secreted protein